ncbi:MAG: hypothetical protein APR53_04530 [Methanoculleus sp. SDB]|nr:MAG: hypothetical protein APR53_04530 [Methanoculleus sp. SDB]
MQKNTDKSLQKILPATAWPIIPIIAFAGIALDFALQLAGILTGESVLLDAGVWGCVAGSVLLAGIAYFRPKKDLVSLLTPMYALIIFNPYSEFSINLLLKALYAATITALSIRLDRQYPSE